MAARRGWVYVIYALVGGPGQVADSVIGGWLYDAVNPVVPFYVNGVVLILCALVIGIWLKEPLVQRGASH